MQIDHVCQSCDLPQIRDCGDAANTLAFCLRYLPTYLPTYLPCLCVFLRGNIKDCILSLKFLMAKPKTSSS